MLSYVRVSPTLEYDPIALKLRQQDGTERPAGFASCQFAFLEEVQRQLQGGGEVTHSGAPPDKSVEVPATDPSGYKGAAAHNPYFTTAVNPLRAGYVDGYSNWFGTIHVLDQYSGRTDYTMSSDYCATAEGAEEALRLVRNFEPGATLGSSRFGSQGGPFVGDGDNYEVVLPGGGRLNAGRILQAYYYGGAGVTVDSDTRLRGSIELANRLAVEMA